MTGDAYYFGCVERAGHYLFDERLQHVRRDPPQGFPMRWESLDGGLFPVGRRGEPDGRVFLNYVNGWTIATFNDRIVDSRPHSNSNFIIRGRHNWHAMKALIAQRFPTVYKRLTFPLVLANDQQWDDPQVYIDRLREVLEENSHLRLALEGIKSDVRVPGCEACAEKESMARAALEDK